jgi:hypothetical protein
MTRADVLWVFVLSIALAAALTLAGVMQAMVAP